jgi:hypothetical protein
LDSRPLATRDMTITGQGKWLATVHRDRQTTAAEIHPSEFEALAHARLISAAPELLAALEGLARHVAIGEGHKAKDFEAYNAAISAIAKAKGQP